MPGNHDTTYANPRIYQKFPKFPRHWVSLEKEVETKKEKFFRYLQEIRMIVEKSYLLILSELVECLRFLWPLIQNYGRKNLIKIQELKRSSIHRALLIVIIIWFILTMGIIFLLNITPAYDNDIERAQTLYLLSAIAQSLAAVFALVFSISLVGVQLLSQYSILFIGP